MTKPCCIRCGEDFPVAEEPAPRWQMGQMREAKLMPTRWRRKLGYDPHDMRGTPYLCGNCFFDIQDEEYEQEAGT